ncbi:hypothetical protein M758_7G055800 [Ceratodon purpureus]|nr:hypothetical protein M758_7G055800 [Ceratodon purpureus]
MASSCAVMQTVSTAQVNASLGAQATSKSTLPSSALFGCKSKASANVALGVAKCKGRVVAEAEGAPKKVDKWAGLGKDISDDQQDIQRGKGMVDALFQGAQGMGTQTVMMSSYDYISTGQRTYNFDNTSDGLYIAPAFMDKLVIHVAKNFMNLPGIKIPLILGIWGGKGQGKSFQSELVMKKLGIKSC